MSSPLSSSSSHGLSFTASKSVSGFKTSQQTFFVERVDFHRRSHVIEVIDLVSDAVNRGDNIGIDEFLSSDELQEKLSNDVNDLFAVRESSACRRLVAAILVEPCQAARTIRPRIASMSVVTSHLISRDLTFLQDVARIAVERVSAVNRGYISCTVSVYYVCVLTLNAWLREGFVVTACIPLAGRLKQTAVPPGEPNVKHTLSYHLYKKLDCMERAYNIQNDSDVELVAFADKICSQVSTHSDDELVRWTRTPSFACLPITVPSSILWLPGKCADASWTRRRALLRHLYRCCFTGPGFSVETWEEMPTLKFFSWLYSRYWNCVVEDSATGEWISVFCIAPSPFSRDRLQPRICDGSLIITPAYRYRRCGLSADLLQVWTQLCVDAGFEACLSDTAFDNLDAIHSSLDIGLVGSLPGAMVSRDPARSSDVILLYKSLENTPSFEKFISQHQG